MRFLVFGVVLGCGGASHPDPVGEPTPVQPANVAPPDAPVSGPAPDAPPPDAPVLAPALASATPWIMRYVHVGLVDFAAGAEVLVLRRHDGDAALEVTRYALDNASTSPSAPAILSSETYLGTFVVPPGGGVRLHFDAFDLACTFTKGTVAAATARRTPSPGASECGDLGRWAPERETAAKIFRCEVVTGALPFASAAPYLGFGFAPGIEYGYVNDDCFQGGGWRAVGAANTFEALRSP